MFNKLILSLSMFAIVGIAHATPVSFAGGVPSGELMTTVQWWMSVDAQGNITALKPKGEAYDGLREKLEAAMHDWHFAAAKSDGQPAPSESVLTVRVALIPDGDDYQMKIASVRAGGSVAEVEMPRFPTHISTPIVRTGTSAIVALKVSYDANGKPTEAILTDDSPIKNVDFVSAARLAVMKWKFEPERVNGEGVPGAMTVSTCFSREEDARSGSTANTPCAWGVSGSRVGTYQDGPMILGGPRSSARAVVVSTF